MLLKDILTEARKPGYKYTEKFVKDKDNKLKETLDRVTLSLEGSDSGVATRLAKRYERLDKSAKLLLVKRDELNAAVKNVGDEVFNASDSLVTRVIETVTYTLTLGAGEKAADKKPKYAIDYEAAYGELAKLVPELTEQVEALTKKYTLLVPAKDTPTSLRVKPKEIKEDLVGSVKAAWGKFMEQLKSWCASYDEKLTALKKKFPV